MSCFDHVFLCKSIPALQLIRNIESEWILRGCLLVMNVELLLTKLLDLLGRQETERGRDILCRDDGLKNQSCLRTIDIDQSNLDPLT